MMTSALYSRSSKHKSAMILLASMLALLLTIIPGLLSSPTPQTAPTDAPVVDFGQLPFQFEANVGQANPDVQFISHAPGGTFFFTSSGVLLSLSAKKNQDSNSQSQQANVAFAAEEAETQGQVVSIA